MHGKILLDKQERTRNWIHVRREKGEVAKSIRLKRVQHIKYTRTVLMVKKMNLVSLMMALCAIASWFVVASRAASTSSLVVCGVDIYKACPQCCVTTDRGTSCMVSRIVGCPDPNNVDCDTYCP